MNKDRVIQIVGEISVENLEIFCEELRALEKESRKPILIELCSHGGETYTALGYYAKIVGSPCEITIKAFGQVMSAATIILASGKKRLMHKDCWFMVHDDCQRVKADNGTIAASEALHKDMLEDHWADILSRHSKESAQFWRAYSKKTTYLRASACLALGIIDEIY